MTRLSASLLVAVVAAITADSQAFVVTSAPQRRSALAMAKNSHPEETPSSSSSSIGRRDALAGVAGAFLASMAAAPEPASAKYSDYARREADWDARTKKGEVKYSSARDLRAQLQEIAPMNTSNSKIFCPNGPSANVSPLMENKCGDRLATPSVYGRQNDVMGNSIPGFKEGYAWGPGESSSMSAATGGFPAYRENEWKVREYGK